MKIGEGDNFKSISDLQQFTDSMSDSQLKTMKELTFEGINAISESVQKTSYHISESINDNNEHGANYHGIWRAATLLKERITEIILGLDLDATQSERAFEVFDNLMQAIEYLKSAFQTPMIQDITRAIANWEYTKIIPISESILSKNEISAADFAFFKIAKLSAILKHDLLYPRGFTTALNKLNKYAATEISKNCDAYYNVVKCAFIFDHSAKEICISSPEVNTIYSAILILNGMTDEFITENELIELLSVLYKTPSLALDNIGAQKIRKKIINIMTSCDSSLKHGFDQNYYFHSRARNTEDVPYIDEELLRAPIGMTGPGRYNYPGRSHYYFSDTKEGAENEVKKHNLGKKIQTICLKPTKNITLLDLSGTMRGGTTFLKYLRFPLKDINDKMPREYLIPCFVGDCCKEAGFDGIKYYGRKNYSNYVTWTDGCFEIVQPPLSAGFYE